MLETFDIYDKDRIPLNKTATRGTPLSHGEYRLAVHVCIFSSDGKMLIQQRAAHKKTHAGFWDLTVGGCAIAGEDSKTAAERELLEELGVKLDLPERPHITVNFDEGFNDMYLVERDIPLELLRLQSEEVQAAKWATCKEILGMIKAGTFIPYFPSLISLLFENQKYYGGIRQTEEKI